MRLTNSYRIWSVTFGIFANPACPFGRGKMQNATETVSRQNGKPVEAAPGRIGRVAPAEPTAPAQKQDINFAYTDQIGFSCLTSQGIPDCV